MAQRVMKAAFVLGTRPEILKLYSVMNAAVAHKQVNPIFIHTGQHYDYEMSQIFLEELQLPKFHHFLNVRSDPQGKQTARLLTAIEKTLQNEKPDVVIVEGDTNTTMSGALAASKLQIPIAHVEAGCRSFDLNMPEEINRLTVDAISSIFFAPSEVAALNLLFEGKPQSRIFPAGNTVVDIVEETRHLRKKIILKGKKITDAPVVVTLHRQENVDNKKRLSSLITALGRIKEKIVFPIHPRTKKRVKEFGLETQIRKTPNLHLVKPLKYLSFMKLLEDARVAITDSGGVQEEAIMVGTPCITARDTTEWPETIWAGGNHLAGTNANAIFTICNKILSEPKTQLAKFTNPFKGNAGPTIIKILTKIWKTQGLTLPKPDMSQGKYPLPWLVDAKALIKNEFYSTLIFNEQGRAIINKKQQAVKKLVRYSKEVN